METHQLGFLGCLAFQLESADTQFLRREVLESTKFLLLLMHIFSLLNSTMKYPLSGGLHTSLIRYTECLLYKHILSVEGVTRSLLPRNDDFVQWFCVKLSEKGAEMVEIGTTIIQAVSGLMRGWTQTSFQGMPCDFYRPKHSLNP